MIHPSRLVVVATVLTTLAAVADARPPMLDGGGPGLGPPAFMKHLYSPRLVMRNRDVIQLTTDQRRAIVRAIGDARRSLADLGAKREPAAAALAEATAAPRVDEDAALARAAALMAIEHDIKRTHLRLLVRVKNLLTPEQQTTLDGLQDEWRTERRRRLRERLRPGGPAPQ